MEKRKLNTKSTLSQREVNLIEDSSMHKLEFEYEKLHHLTLENYKFHLTSFMAGTSAAAIILGVAFSSSKPQQYWLISIALGLFLWFIIRQLNYTTKMRTPQEKRLHKLEEQLNITVWRTTIPFMIQISDKPENKIVRFVLWFLKILFGVAIITCSCLIVYFAFKAATFKLQ